MAVRDDDEFYDYYITCKDCGNKKAYVWFDKRLRMYLVSCDNCGVREVDGGGLRLVDMKQYYEDIEKVWKHRCEGQSDDYKVILQSDDGKWDVLDVGVQHVIPIVFCPYCGCKLISSMGRD